MTHHSKAGNNEHASSSSSPLQSSKELFLYSFLAIPLAFAGLPIYLHAPDLYATNLNLSLGSLGLTLLGLRIFDALQDPFIGSLSDIFHKQRTLIISAGLILLVTGFWMLFHPLKSRPLLWFGGSILICTTGFSIVSINFQTLGGLWSGTKTGRTQITSWREGFGLLGLLLAAGGPTLLAKSGDAFQSFHLLSLVYLPLIFVSAVLFFLWLRTAPLGRPFQKNVPFLDLNTNWNRHFFGIYLFNSLAATLPAILILFFVRDHLRLESYTSIFLLLYFLSGAFSMPLWQKIATRIGKERAWCFSLVGAAFIFVWASQLTQGQGIAFGAISILSGLTLGADLTFPPSILADHIADQKEEQAATRYFSLMTFVSKLALALGTGLVFPLLDLLGYRPGTIQETTNQAFTAPLSLTYALIPSLIKVLVGLWLWHFLCRPSLASHSGD